MNIEKVLEDYESYNEASYKEYLEIKKLVTERNIFLGYISTTDRFKDKTFEEIEKELMEGVNETNKNI
jgi:hypothetical protein